MHGISKTSWINNVPSKREIRNESFPFQHKTVGYGNYVSMNIATGFITSRQCSCTFFCCDLISNSVEIDPMRHDSDCMFVRGALCSASGRVALMGVHTDTIDFSSY